MPTLEERISRPRADGRLFGLGSERTLDDVVVGALYDASRGDAPSPLPRKSWRRGRRNPRKDSVAIPRCSARENAVAVGLPAKPNANECRQPTTWFFCRVSLFTEGQ